MIKILTIVEKKDDLFKLKALLLKSFPNELLLFGENGKEGITIGKLEHPDIILLDLAIPLMNGSDVLTGLKYERLLYNIPVIILTTEKSHKKSRVKAIDLGADAFIYKPFDEVILTTQIKDILRLRESEDFRNGEAWRLSLLVKERTKQLEKELQESKRVENELRTELKNVEVNKTSSLQERILLRTLIDNLPHTIYVKDLEKRKTLANRADLKLIGKSESEVIGKTDQEIFPPNEAELFDVDDDLVLSTGMTVLDREELIVNPEGQGVWLLTSKLPLFDHKGKITGLIGIGHDITTRKQAEQELKESELRLKQQNEEYIRLNHKYSLLNEELTKSLKQIHKINSELQIAVDKAEESDRLKLAFLSNMSHEIRTPMNAIMGFSQLLTKSNMTCEKRNNIAQIISTSCDQLLTIINDILDISKIEAGQISMFPEIFGLDNLYTELIPIFDFQAKNKGLNLIYTRPEKYKTLQLNTDRNRLKQVLGNLFSNAIKFTETGEIVYGFHIKKEHIELFVRDTGIGISAENSSLIFNRFHQVDSSCTRKYGGNGLGLPISKAFVDNMGGKITLDSKEGIGSVFTVNLPIEMVSGNTIKQGKIKIKVILKGSYKQEILIVEDEINNFLFIEELLSDKQFKITHAWNGAEAVEMFNHNPSINIVLMDIKMPVMDGYEAMKQIKVNNSDIPVIALTAYAMMEEKENALRAGFDNYISKPVKQDILLKILAEYAMRDNNKET